MKFREVRRMLREDGWSPLPRTGTSHEHWVHTTKTGRVTVAGSDGDDVARGTLRNILRQAGLDWPPRR
jgi:predicted RNA binding protein YcfA (HicA-like mRNA interferase family)